MTGKHILIGAALYAVAGVATLLWQTERAGTGQSIWPGLGSQPPGAALGMAETVLLWPLALPTLLG